jgi:cytochrome c oxidase assembly protein Cox11
MYTFNKKSKKIIFFYLFLILLMMIGIGYFLFKIYNLQKGSQNINFLDADKIIASSDDMNDQIKGFNNMLLDLKFFKNNNFDTMRSVIYHMPKHNIGNTRPFDVKN